MLNSLQLMITLCVCEHRLGC